MNDLRGFISNLCRNSNAFISSEHDLLTQLEYVNRNTALSTSIQCINDQPILKALFCSKDGNQLLTRQHHMTLAAIKFKWDSERIKRKYQKQTKYISFCQKRKL